MIKKSLKLLIASVLVNTVSFNNSYCMEGKVTILDPYDLNPDYIDMEYMSMGG